MIKYGKNATVEIWRINEILLIHFRLTQSRELIIADYVKYTDYSQAGKAGPKIDVRDFFKRFREPMTREKRIELLKLIFGTIKQEYRN